MRARVLRAHRQTTRLLERCKILHHGLRLFRRRQPSPQRIESGCVAIRRPLPGQQVVIEKESGFLIPEIARNQLLPLFRALAPLFRIGRAAQPAADLLQIFLSLIEQAVQAHRRIVMRRGAEWPKAKTNVESRFPHRPVALIVIGTQFELLPLLALRVRHRKRNLTRGMKKEIRRDLPVNASLVLQCLGRRTLPEIVVARQSRVARQVRISVPHLIIFFKIGISSREPRRIPVS